jgi:uncharacterized RDD family membrane protein YckC
MDSPPPGSTPLDPDLADLLAGYRHVLRFADARVVGAVPVGDGRWLRHVRVLVSTAFLRPIVAAHASRTVAELSRALHYEAATGGGDRDAALASLEHFRQSLPEVPIRRYTVGFLGAALACALLVSNFVRALAPAELDQASHAISDLAGAAVTVDTSGLVDGLQKFTVGSATAAAVLITAALYVVALVPLGSFRLKRILFNHHPAARADVREAIAGHERRQATGLYECEARVFAAHGLPAPCERPVDLGASAVIAAFPLLLGVAALVSQEPRQAIGKADSAIVNFVLVPVAQVLLIVLPLAMFYRLSDVRLDRLASRPDIRVFRRDQLAGVAGRLAALTIDWLLAWLLVAVLGEAVLVTLGEDAPAAAFYFAVMPLAFTTATVPFVLRRGGRRGQSLGKQLMRMRVVDAEGDRLRTSQILVREVLVKSLLLFGIAFLLAYVPLLVDLVLTARDPQRRAIEDRVATTRVVRAGVPMTESAGAEPRVLVAA